MQTLPAPRELILEQLERMLASETFAGAERSRVLLRFLVEQALENQSDRLKEYTIGAEALGRGDSFDPRTDPIVRAEASRLRSRIERYYATNGAADTVLITLPRGSYVPRFETRAVPESAPAAVAAGGLLSVAGRLQRSIWFILGGITVGVAVMLFVLMRDEAPTAEFDGLAFPVELGGADHSLGADVGNDVILSPDGRRIVFVVLGSDHVSRLMTAVLGQPQTVVPLPGTEGARAPFFSPDGRTVGFWVNPKLKMVAVGGGSPIELTDAASFGGASWGQDGIIASIDGALRRISLTSRQSTVIADLRKEGFVQWWPELLPGGQHVLYTAVGPHGPDASNVEVLSLADGKRKQLVTAGFGRYLSPGYLLYVNQGTLFAVPFDRQRLEVQGTGVPVLDERVAYSTIFGNAKFDVAPNGTLIYRRSPPLVASWLYRGGKSEPLLKTPGPYTFPRLSLNGQRLALNVSDSGVLRTEIHDLNRPEKPADRLPFTPGSMSTVWHPDGFLVLGSHRGMSWMKADDMTRLETLTTSSDVQIPWSFTSDGTQLVYSEASQASPTLDLWTVPIKHSGGKLTIRNPEPFLRTPFYESQAAFSPDGRWMLFGWGPNGKWNVYAQPVPRDDSYPPTPVSKEGGRIGRWMRNGREIVYRTDDHRLMIVEHHVKHGKFVVGDSREWTNVRLADTGVIPNFDVDPNGDRILGLVPASREEAERFRTQVMVMPRFADAVRRRLSGGGK